MQADGQRHPAPVIGEPPYAVRKPRSGQRDRPFGQPETVLRRQQPNELADIVVVVERLAAAHEHHARDRALFSRAAGVAVYGDDFGEHLGGIEVALETFLPRRTERAAHLATYLRGHADARAVVVRDIDAFCKVAAEKTEEIFLAAVRGDADSLGRERERNKIVRERLAERLRERGHLGDLSAVQTKRSYLPCGVSGRGRGKQRRYLVCLKPKQRALFFVLRSPRHALNLATKNPSQMPCGSTVYLPSLSKGIGITSGLSPSSRSINSAFCSFSSFVRVQVE